MRSIMKRRFLLLSVLVVSFLFQVANEGTIGRAQVRRSNEERAAPQHTALCTYDD
jgi:hypothetical protein